MVKKKVDSRIVGLIENGVRMNHRSMFVLVGDYGKNQVENLHRILSKIQVKSRPNVLWCYKKELGFSTHRKKRMNEIKRDKARGLHDADVDDPFDLFISSTDIRWCYYKDTEKILGKTYGLCVLQDFEALTPNLLARTIETVEGGGLVIFLLKTVKSLKQLYTMTMDVHSRFRTEAYHDIVPRFNERFILSLSECNSCLVLDDELNILPISNAVNQIPLSSQEFGGGGEGASSNNNNTDLSGHKIDPELKKLKDSLIDTPYLGVLVEQCKTVDQAKAVLSFLDAVSEKSQRGVVSLTAARGRGKSASIGLCLAGAIAYGYGLIYITAPSPENLQTAFEFIIKGLVALKYKEHLDYTVSYTTGESGKIMVGVTMLGDHHQFIRYAPPSDITVLSSSELIAIDEAAAIPLPTVKSLLGSKLVFLSSTVNGYEGTGRALSLKLVAELRRDQAISNKDDALAASAAVSGSRRMKGERKLHEERWKVASKYAASGQENKTKKLTELTLNTPIRYSSGDAVEEWLNELLCLNSLEHLSRIVMSTPPPSSCDLYLVDRDALFSRHSLSEALLQRIWSLYTSAHYKNTPNDLQMLSDAPSHRLFVLLGPRNTQHQSTTKGVSLPDILCVLQVAFEGRISAASVKSEMSRGNKASGDMIPWVMSQQYNDHNFAGLSGARVVRIATHPDVQKLGYGSYAISLLCKYFNGEVVTPGMRYEGTLDPDNNEGNSSSISGKKNKKKDKDGDNGESTLKGEEVVPRSKLPSLLTPISQWPTPRLHWLGVSFGLTVPLLNFWSRAGFQVCYVRQTKNELTGEHSTMALKELIPSDSNSSSGLALIDENSPTSGWLNGYILDYRHRLQTMLGMAFRNLNIPLATCLIDPNKDMSKGENNGNADSNNNDNKGGITAAELTSAFLSPYDVKRLELYARNMVDHHMILDIVPTVARLLFSNRIKIRLSALQICILIAIGLQMKDVDTISSELDLPSNQVLAFFNKTMRKISTSIASILEEDVEKTLHTSRIGIANTERIAANMNSLSTSLDADQTEADHVFNQVLKNSTSISKTIPSSISVPKSKTTSSDGDNDNDKNDEDRGSLSKKKDKSKKSNKKKRDHSDSIGNDDNGSALKEEKKKKKKSKNKE